MNNAYILNRFNEYAIRESAMYKVDDKPDIDKLKVMYISSELFGITTYDDDLDVFFGVELIEVIKVLLNRTNFEYIKDFDNYVKFIRCMNLFEKIDAIEWGTSIRGAWLNEPEVWDWLIYDFLGYIKEKQ